MHSGWLLPNRWRMAWVLSGGPDGTDGAACPGSGLNRSSWACMLIKTNFHRTRWRQQKFSVSAFTKAPKNGIHTLWNILTPSIIVLSRASNTSRPLRFDNSDAGGYAAGLNSTMRKRSL
ncbi:hypothetical protein BJ741DRAFT_639532 [Chytriomyces cf. hyalinus JEL632]|nr:hypothetical protein BJ741DRAFT_639532 [Chytriomyces cf. hyalinus JEL632]